MSRLHRIRIICCILIVTAVCCAQQPPMGPELQLLDRLAGDWVLQGTIGGKQTTHDVHAEWVLNRGYLRLHEISREKNSSGNPAYEAIIFISWEAKAQEYACLWLDSTEVWDFSAHGIGRAKRSGASITFIFTTTPPESTHTTFAYDQSTETWKWVIDDETNGKTHRFADVKLTRAH